MATGRRPVAIQVARAGESVGEFAEHPAAAPESRMVSRYLPFHSAMRREVADLVAAGAHVPRLGDQLHLATTGSCARGRRSRQLIDIVELARQRGGRSKRKPSTCISVTQYRSESMIGWSDRGCRCSACCRSR